MMHRQRSEVSRTWILPWKYRSPLDRDHSTDFTERADEPCNSLAALTTGSSFSLSCVPFQISFSIPCSSPAASKPSNAWTVKKFRVRRSPKILTIMQATYVKRTMLSLSSKPVLWSDRWNRASVFPMLSPGWWCMMKSNQAKSRDHLACLQLSLLAIMKYCRFLWSIQISQWCSTPSTKCLHSSNALTIANISLLWIS